MDVCQFQTKQYRENSEKVFKYFHFFFFLFTRMFWHSLLRAHANNRREKERKQSWNNEQLLFQFSSCAGIDYGAHARAKRPSIVRRSEKEKINRPWILSYLATAKQALMVHHVTALSKKNIIYTKQQKFLLCQALANRWVFQWRSFLRVLPRPIFLSAGGQFYFNLISLLVRIRTWVV